MTICDDGVLDTYDFSNYTTNLRVDLNPGAWTTVSTAQSHFWAQTMGLTILRVAISPMLCCTEAMSVR